MISARTRRKVRTWDSDDNEDASTILATMLTRGTYQESYSIGYFRTHIYDLTVTPSPSITHPLMRWGIEDRAPLSTDKPRRVCQTPYMRMARVICDTVIPDVPKLTQRTSDSAHLRMWGDSWVIGTWDALHASHLVHRGRISDTCLRQASSLAPTWPHLATMCAQSPRSAAHRNLRVYHTAETEWCSFGRGTLRPRSRHTGAWIVPSALAYRYGSWDAYELGEGTNNGANAPRTFVGHCPWRAALGSHLGL